MSTAKLNLVFFGVEVSDYTEDCDVLQIAMKCGSAVFNEYIDPTKPVNEKLTKINHLTNRNWHLYRDGSVMPSRPRRIVIQRLLEFMKKLERPCILIAHRTCSTNAVCLLRVIKNESQENEFKAIIAGFVDTFPMFKEIFPDKDVEHLTLHRLGYEANVLWHRTFKNGRCVKHNAVLLERIALYHFTAKDFETQMSLQKIIKKFAKQLNLQMMKEERAEQIKEKAERVEGGQNNKKKEEKRNNCKEEDEERRKMKQQVKARKRAEKKAMKQLQKQVKNIQITEQREDKEAREGKDESQQVNS